MEAVLGKHMSLGLQEALSLTLERIKPLPVEYVELIESIDRTAAAELYARVDSPSIDASLKDGYAVYSCDVADATPEKPVRLRLAGSLAAGGEKQLGLTSGTAVRVLTGARIPSDADAVVSEEFVEPEGNDVLVAILAEPGRNILPQGSDVACQERIIRAGQQISPGMTGLLAAAGHSKVPVFKKPTVGIVGIGNEIVTPGGLLTDGNIFASNIMTLAAWCNKYRIKSRMTIVQDDFDALFSTLKTMTAEMDAILTSGGAGRSERDMVARVLEQLGWQEVFHRIRIGPGKAVGFGLVDKKPVFILPGVPSANLMGFLQIALPGLLSLAGQENPGLPRMNALLGAELRGREPDWTDFFFGTLSENESLPIFHPLQGRSRLWSIAAAEAVATIPEGQGFIPKGTVISVQLLK
jgi:molybdopterin molybdotransferase